jgi:hypothetical protein
MKVGALSSIGVTFLAVGCGAQDDVNLPKPEQAPESGQTAAPAPTPEPEQHSLAAFESSCGGSIQAVEGVFSFPSDWCFYRGEFRPGTTNYELRFEARSVDGDGYGVWLRGDWNDGLPSAPGVQYIPAPFGDTSRARIDFLRYPETERHLTRIRRSLDRAWHRWSIVADASSVTFHLDDEQLQTMTQPSDEVDFGFRTWRGEVEVRGMVLVLPP